MRLNDKVTKRENRAGVGPTLCPKWNREDQAGGMFGLSLLDR